VTGLLLSPSSISTSLELGGLGKASRLLEVRLIARGLAVEEEEVDAAKGSSTSD